jgi:hypothetical protein
MDFFCLRQKVIGHELTRKATKGFAAEMNACGI